MLISCHSWTTQVQEIAMTDILICEIHIAWHAGMPIECLLLQSCMQREGSFGCQGLHSLAMNAMTSSLEYVNATQTSRHALESLLGSVDISEHFVNRRGRIAKRLVWNML